MKRRPITRVLVVFMSLLLICTSVLAVPSSVEAAAKPRKITVSAKKKTLYVGQKYKLTVKSVTPSNASKAVKFTTSNKKVATVSAKGQITAKQAGSATITATSKSNSKVRATCKITVKPAVKSITVKNAVSNTVAVRLKKTLKLKASVLPTNAGNKKLTFKSSNKKVVSVDKKGKLKAKKAGKATITIKALGGKATKRIKAIVPAKNQEVKGVKLSATTKTLTIGSNFTLKPTITPAKVATKLVSYTTSNAKVATVSAKGKVVAVAPGTATITVKTLDGAKKATCKVTVTPVYVKGIALSSQSETLDVGKSVTLTATVTPANAANKTLKWTSSNTAVATVADGVVTAVAPGTATITAASTDGSNVVATCTITVNKVPVPEEPKPEEPKEVKVTSIILDKKSAELEVGGSVAITATVAPTNATNKEVVWTTSDATVATVEKGVVTAKAAGTATITATAADGSGVKATATITVKAKPEPPKDVKVTEIILNPTSAELEIDETVTITATVAPANATNKNVVWASDKASVATVENGVVKAKAAGTATITATAADGSGVKATAVITVKAKPEPPVEDTKVTGITLNPTTAELEVGQTVTITATVAPADATNKEVEWTTSNATVATVANGVVTAVAPGTATITVAAMDGSGVKAIATITVKAKPEPVVPIESISLEDMVIYANETDAKLTATVLPENTTMDKAVTYRSGNMALLLVEADGTLKPDIFNLNGVLTNTVDVEVTATAVAQTEITATCIVTIILKEDARTEDDYKYNFTLKKNAETIDITRGGRVVSVSMEALEQDIETIAAIEWSNESLRKYWDTEEIKKLISDLVFGQEFSQYVRVEVVDEDTMKVTAKGKTVVVERIDNADGTANLVINAGSRTVEVQNINVVSDETNYTITATAVAKGKKLDGKVVIAKDASKAEVYRVRENNTTEMVLKAESTTTAYEVEVNKNLYQDMLEFAGVEDSLTSLSVMNAYIPAE